MAQGIVVVEILVTQGQGVYPLADGLAHAVFSQIRIAAINELLGQPLDDPGPRLDFPSSKPPPSELMAPPSKRPTTTRLFRP